MINGAYIPDSKKIFNINLLNTELNPIYHLLTLLGAHPIFHISRISVKLSTMTHHFDKVTPSSVSERDLLIRHGLNMYVTGEESHEYKIT